MCTNVSTGDTTIGYEQQCFEVFCKERYVNRNNQTSKTILKDKGQKKDFWTAQDQLHSSELQLTVQVLGEKVWVSAEQLFSPP